MSTDVLPDTNPRPTTQRTPMAAIPATQAQQRDPTPEIEAHTAETVGALALVAGAANTWRDRLGNQLETTAEEVSDQS